MANDRVDVLTAEEFIKKVEEGIDFSFIFLPKTERSRLQLLAKERYDTEKSSLNKYLFARTIFVFDHIKDRYPLAKKLLLEACKEDFVLALYDVSGAMLEAHYNFSQNYEESFNLLKRASDLGYIPATFELGHYYFEGIGVKANADTALSLIVKAANEDYPVAIGTLGAIYEEGIYVPKDMDKAIELFLKASSLGDVVSNYNLGRIYSTGEGIEIDYNKAAIYLEKAWEEGFIPAYPYYGLLYIRGYGVPRNVRKGIKMIEEAVKSDDERGLCILGDLYLEGDAIEQDYEKAYRCFARGLEINKDNIYCIYQLGVLYINGNGVKKNAKKAFQYFQTAASGGLVLANYYLGNCYLFGEGTKANSRLAYENMKIAYSFHVSGAAYMMARFYRFGVGTRKNKKKMIEAYIASVEEEDPYGYFYYGQLLNQEAIKERDKEKLQYSLELIKKAADKGHAEAQFFHALNLKEAKKYDEYIQYLNMSAACGFANAFTELGNLYHFGKIVSKDDAKALAYFKRGAKLSSQSSILCAGHFYEFGIGTEASISEAMKFYSQLDGFTGSYDILIPIVEQLKNGIGIKEPNYKRAFFILKNMLTRDDIEKPYIEIGVFYENGYAVKRNYNTAAKYYIKAAEEKVDDVAYLYLSRLYANHKDEINDKKVLQHILAAANSNVGYASYGMGIILLNNDEEDTDNEKAAKKYFKIAAKNGIADAYYYFGCIEKDYKKSKEYYLKGKDLGSALCYCELGVILFGEGKIEESNQILLESLSISNQGAKYLAAHYLLDCLDEKYLDEIITNLIEINDDPEACFYLSFIFAEKRNNIDLGIRYAYMGYQLNSINCGFMYGLYSIIKCANDKNYNLGEFENYYKYLEENYEYSFPIKLYLVLFAIIRYMIFGHDKKRNLEMLKTYFSLDVSKKILSELDMIKGNDEYDPSGLFKAVDNETIVDILKDLISYLYIITKETNKKQLSV